MVVISFDVVVVVVVVVCNELYNGGGCDRAVAVAVDTCVECDRCCV